MKRPINIAILISSLEFGGAERQAIELFKSLDRSRIKPILCVLSNNNPLSEHLPNGTKDLIVINKRFKYDFTAIFRFARLILKQDIKLVHCFLFDAEMVARLSAFFLGRPIVISSERNSNYKHRFIHHIMLSLTKGLLKAMIANSAEGKQLNIETFQIPEHKIFVVRNGIDLDHFRPSLEDGRNFRTSMDIPLDANVIGMAASFKPQKRHQDFLRAAKKILIDHPNTFFFLVGEKLPGNIQGTNQYHDEIRLLIKELGLEHRCLQLGNRNDMPSVYNACDLMLLPSSREGTPNVLLEAMSCAVPMIATNISDNSLIIQHAKTGFLVEVGDVDNLARYSISLIEDKSMRERIGTSAREAITRDFSTSALARKTESVYFDYLGRDNFLRAPH